MGLKKGAEDIRLAKSSDNRTWRKWGPYITERQWGTVREDYSKNGNTWEAITHDQSRSNAYRWGEDGIAGFCDNQQILCLAPAFWNGKDPILKERLFGLTNWEGNHGEDVKELYYHLASSPTHSYCKYLYKYPQSEFPYNHIVKENGIRDRNVPEYELVDTGIFNERKYFDIFIEYAKADVNDILMKITIYNRADSDSIIHVLPHLWYRNFWKHNSWYKRPKLSNISENMLQAYSERNGMFYFYHQEGYQLYCENETNNKVIYNSENEYPYVKDGINDYVVANKKTVNPDLTGTKCAIHITKIVPAKSSIEIKIRLSKKKFVNPWEQFDDIFEARIKEHDAFYDQIIPKKLEEGHKKLIKSAFGGLLWTKQYYYLDIFKWLNGEQGKYPPERTLLRNADWQHLGNRNILSMPDKWEYPWYAAWDLAFHTVSFAHIDIEFAKRQLLILLRDNYLHPNGQIPAYEWNFSDVNPPVHAWAVWELYIKDKKSNGKGDYSFLEKSFQKLLLNFTWWVNQKDAKGINIFEGGFLGLDNIGVFDRSNMPKDIKNLQQADGTSWMAMFSLNMLQISLELANYNISYEESASKFFRHYLNIAWAMHHIGKKEISLWDDEDAFYYDEVLMKDGSIHKLKVRSLVGIIPLMAVEVIHEDTFQNLRRFKRRAVELMKSRPNEAELISRIEHKNNNGDHLFAIMRSFRLEKLLERLLDEKEFLSDFGIRSLSKHFQDNPYVFEYKNKKHTIQYEPGESNSFMFGGNSNWRGPIWLPLNYLIIKSLKKYYRFYGPEYTYEYPKGSGQKLNLKEVAKQLTNRLLSMFEEDEKGKFHYYSENDEYAKDQHFRDHHQFFEFFDGDTGKGLGASHQTGWTALIANLLLEIDDE